MSVVVVGLNHKTAPIATLEQLTIGPELLPKALHQLGTYEHIVEGVILSTCNRTEVYVLASKFHGGAQDLRNFLAEFCHVAPEEFADHLYTYYEEGAVRHLLRVAAGIDSMVIGESEILGQVRRAFQVASDEGMVQRVLGDAFRRALRVGKRARTDTAIGRNPVSVSSAAVELARRAFSGGTLAGKRVTIVGAGKMGSLAAKALASAGATDVTLVSRTHERASELAGLVEATARPMEELEAAVGGSDILICSTTAPAPVLDRALVERALAGREDRPLFIVDIAVPRDVDTAVAEIPGVVLRDIDDLRGVVESGVGSRLAEVSRVEEIISEEIERFVEWERTTDVLPTVAALTERAEAIRAAELQRLYPRLDDRQRAAVDAATKKMFAKLLHGPLNKAKELGTSKQGHLYLTAMRELFELDDEQHP